MSWHTDADFNLKTEDGRTLANLAECPEKEALVIIAAPDMLAVLQKLNERGHVTQEEIARVVRKATGGPRA